MLNEKTPEKNGSQIFFGSREENAHVCCDRFVSLFMSHYLSANCAFMLQLVCFFALLEFIPLELTS